MGPSSRLLLPCPLATLLLRALPRRRLSRLLLTLPRFHRTSMTLDLLLLFINATLPFALLSSRKLFGTSASLFGAPLSLKLKLVGSFSFVSVVWVATVGKCHGSRCDRGHQKYRKQP